MKRIIAAIIVLAAFDIGYAADWKISAAYADGESARVVIDTTQALRGPCALKNESGATIAAMESPPMPLPWR